MNIEQDPKRNKPAEEGRNNDPDLRDDSAVRPGVSTVSSSDTDDEDKELTETAADDFRTGDEDEKADRSFDEVDFD